MAQQTTIATKFDRAPSAPAAAMPPLAAAPTAAVAAATAVVAKPMARPLLVRFGAMGDMVMMTTLVRALAARFGSPVDILSSGSWTRPLLAGQPGVGDVYLLANRSLPYLLSTAQQAMARLLRRRGPGPTWYCDGDGKCLELMRRSGIGEHLICNVRDLPMNPGEHLVDYWQRFARASPAGLGPGASTAGAGPSALSAGAGPDTSPAGAGPGSAGDVGSHEPELRVSREAVEDLDRWLAANRLAGRQLLLVQPGNKRTMRRGPRRRPSNTKWWPEARWALVVKTMAQMHPQAAIVMLGVPREYDLNEQIIALAGTPAVFNAARDLPIPRLMALQSRASGMISVDTGPAHCAAAVGCPVVVLFGVADPARISPRGRAPVRDLTGCGDDGASMLGISVEQVLAQWRALPKRAPQRVTGVPDQPGPAAPGSGASA